jgi:hypothetical protein
LIKSSFVAIGLIHVKVDTKRPCSYLVHQPIFEGHIILAIDACILAVVRVGLIGVDVVADDSIVLGLPKKMAVRQCFVLDLPRAACLGKTIVVI